MGEGRPDRRFCSVSCRIDFHNEQKIAAHHEIRQIELALKKNRKILKKYFIPGKDKPVGREILLKAGFEFSYHTHHIVSKIKGNEFIFCFDYGYREVAPGRFQIIEAFK